MAGTGSAGAVGGGATAAAGTAGDSSRDVAGTDAAGGIGDPSWDVVDSERSETERNSVDSARPETELLTVCVSEEERRQKTIEPRKSLNILRGIASPLMIVLSDPVSHVSNPSKHL